MVAGSAFSQHIQKGVRPGNPDAAENVNPATQEWARQQADRGTDKDDTSGPEVVWTPPKKPR